MKKWVSLLVLLLLFSTSVYAQTTYFEKSVEKAKQGLVNFFTGWLEVPYQISKGYNDGWGESQNKLLGGFFGIFRGIIHGLGRTSTGIYQFVTFPLPNPKDNKGVGIPLDSENVWDGGTQYSIVNQGLEPVGKKAYRGFVNTFGCLFEVPSQLHKGFSQDHPFVGLGKAIVYPLGRATSGIYDLVTVVLPNNVEGYGYALSEKMPWDGLDKNKWDNDK
ncbi:MAG: exosortase system-associated protein, TIGR04073 family [Candidatus Omnitrophica bacterium]|nr:exosortase system-associated protein, TIGR04073 family [Candidatus Omnitrophota bacterium]